MTPDDGDADGGTRLLLEIRHPDCWAIEVTERVPGGLLGHGVHRVDGTTMGRFTAYAPTRAVLGDLLSAVEASPLTDEVTRIDGPAADRAVRGRASRGLVVTADAAADVHEPLVSRGFLPDAPVRVSDGRKYWRVVTTADRETVCRRLDEVREECDAEVDVRHVGTPSDDPGGGPLPDDRLSDRQREVFDLARLRGYYTWPRTVSAGDLAEELGLAEATLLEHLRKAEAKLFDADG